jgi:site-specific DNA recombinase
MAQRGPSSTDEQARSGYSLAQQLEALRAYAAREEYEVLEEVQDPGQSGASLERPGMDRVRDLVAAGGVAVVLAQDRDRFAREPAYHYLLRKEFEEHGTKIRALNDRDDDSPEGELTDGILDQLAKYERAKVLERSRRGKLRKAREGKVIATYRPHTHEEISRLVRTEVAARLDPQKSYGVWWFNRRRTSLTQISEPNPDGGGRVYRKVEKVAFRDKGEWIAVPVPDAGIPLEWVDAARAMLAQCRSPSKVDGRFWELSGALMRCGECGRAMEAMVKTARKKSGGKYVFCYYRCREGNRRRETCSNNKCIRSDWAHAAVWELVSGLLSEPGRLREGLEAMIEEERKGLRGDPEHESKHWLKKLAEIESKREGYLELAAEGFMRREELRTKLAALEESRETAERELQALKGRSELLRNLQREKDAIMERYAGMVPEALETLSPQERHRVYRMLRLKVVAHPGDTMEVQGVFGDRFLGTQDVLRDASFQKAPAARTANLYPVIVTPRFSSSARDSIVRVRPCRRRGVRLEPHGRHLHRFRAPHTAVGT